MARPIGSEQIARAAELASRRGPILCGRCGEWRPVDRFYVRANGRVQTPCRDCRATRDRARYAADPDAPARAKARYNANLAFNRERARTHQIRRKYGLSPEEYDSRLAGQGGKCAICGSSEPGMAHMVVPLVVDHDHESNAVRGLLCVQCNAGLGQFADDPDRLLTAAMYLLRFADVLGSPRGGAT